MSRSFKNIVSGTNYIRTTCCVVNHCAKSKWRSGTQRWKRRKNKRLIKQFVLTGDEQYLDKLVDKINRTKQGDPWAGPHDGFYFCNFKDYYGYMK